MRIKHYAGYGCVTATKVTTLKKNDGRPYTVTFVKVSGNHEVGLERPFHDLYCIEKWLGRFMPKGHMMTNYDVVDAGYEKIDGLDVEYALYKLMSVEEKQ